MLRLSKLTIESADTEDHLIFSGFTDDGKTLTQEQAERIFSLPAEELESIMPESSTLHANMVEHYKTKKQEILEEIGTRNASLFEAEMDKLDSWADDKRVTLWTYQEVGHSQYCAHDRYGLSYHEPVYKS